MLDSFRNETLLLFRQFGDAGTNAAVGQLSLSRIVAAEPPSPPLYLTDDPQQNWYQDMALDPRTGRAEILKVRASYGGITPGLASTQALPKLPSTRLTADADPVAALSVATGADPALDPLEVDKLSTRAGRAGDGASNGAQRRTRCRRQPDGAAVFRNTGAGHALRTTAVAGALDFNETRTVEMRIPAQAGVYPLYAEVAGGQELSSANDRAALTLGQLTAPGVGTIAESQTYLGAFGAGLAAEGGRVHQRLPRAAQHDAGWSIRAGRRDLACWVYRYACRSRGAVLLQSPIV